ncbi:type ISP restriction/modification enzyme [Hyphobacterium sp.]|uniref:type ISP restriction/modification enzyme n=1 Tax=Hyphobacterium sp. TaxID=2004662 RepID=UPI003BA9DDF4
MGLVATYFDEISEVYASGVAREHAYRPALERLFNALHDEVQAINEPRRTEVGAPDFIFYDRNGVAVGVCEAKDIDKGLETLKDYSIEQKQRYLKGFPNLLYTNSLDFEFYRDGALIRKISIGDILMGLQPKPEAFDELEAQLRDFVTETPRTITHSKQLAEFMAAKAAIIKDVMGRALVKDLEGEGSELTAQYDAFKEHLIHDISVADFADIYAETIAYGMFAARLHDPTLDTFSREEALTLLPKSNPFLRSLFGYIAGQELDDRIAWIIDDLAKIFLATNLREIMADFGKLTAQNDPFLHFYETFLSAYNPKKRKARGVWYTPEPVVNFIVRAVDEVLQTEFGLADGLADTSKIQIEVETGQTAMTAKGKLRKDGKSSTTTQEVHRVQILDPATGTGTFLAEVIKLIAGRVKGVAPGMWSSYIEKELIPRLHGFELLMASYAMCHLKIDMILSELGYRPSDAPPRLSVWLTNSLEEGEPADQTLPFARWLSNETKGANEVKRDKPIMCVIGNPPYSIQSGNLTKEQIKLVDKYRFVGGEKIKEKGMLQFEKNINNDYIKFISLAENFVSKNEIGVLGFITSHGFLKSASFRGLRSHLLNTFDRIWILDLHGNSEVREVPPKNVSDANVFDIKQGVAITIAFKGRERTKSIGKIYYSEIWGSRQYKYDRLATAALTSLDWVDCKASAQNYTFHPSGEAFEAYQKEYPSLAEIMPVYSSGVITARDKFSISERRETLVERAKLFAESKNLSDSELCDVLGISQKKGWDVSKARERLASESDYGKLIRNISYRPFDDRKILFHDSVVWTTAKVTMSHLDRPDNIALISARSEKSGTCSHFFVSRKLVETKCGERTTQSAIFPLYLFPENEGMDLKRTNFDKNFEERVKATALDGHNTEPNEVDIFDYIYGVLHSPDYRETFKEFLKIDFPRVPYPASPDVFWHVAEKGGELRRLHLMEDAAIGDTPYPFEGEGDNIVAKPVFTETKDGAGHVWINDDQCFVDIPALAWDFFIGGYQPAQKWLKDRKGRALEFADIKHYQKIIKILTETDRIMKEIKLPIEVDAK